ncbi:MAG: very short patch repair endonuclease [Acidimicrobiia bacterium]
MQKQRSKDTTVELAVRRALHRLGLRYRVHRQPLPTLRRTADVVFGRARVAVFVDGCFWHGCPHHGHVPSASAWYWPAKIERNRRRDLDTSRRLEEAGWLAIRVWEHEAPDDAATRIAALVAQRSG